eukprot:2154654-Prymnesium_polylepis.5
MRSCRREDEEASGCHPCRQEGDERAVVVMGLYAPSASAHAAVASVPSNTSAAIWSGHSEANG